MKCSHHVTRSEIQSEVLGYLDEQPNAADSIEGIRQWWLLQRMAKYSLGRVQQAVEELETAQLIERHTLADGRVVYAKSRSPARQAQ